MARPLITLEVNRQLSTEQAIGLFQLLPDVEAIQEVDVVHRTEHLREHLEATGALERRGSSYVPVVVAATALKKMLNVRVDDIDGLRELLVPYGLRVQIDSVDSITGFSSTADVRQVVLGFTDIEAAWSVCIDWFYYVNRRTAELVIPELDAASSCLVCGCTDDNCLSCIERTGIPCHWVGEQLCSACADDAGRVLAPDDFTSPHGHGLTVKPDPYGTGAVRFTIGSVEGAYYLDEYAYHLLAIINQQPGNGDLDDVFAWFEALAQQNGRDLTVLEVQEERFNTHLIGKRGFRAVLDTPNVFKAVAGMGTPFGDIFFQKPLPPAMDAQVDSLLKLHLDQLNERPRVTVSGAEGLVETEQGRQALQTMVEVAFAAHKRGVLPNEAVGPTVVVGRGAAPGFQREDCLTCRGTGSFGDRPCDICHGVGTIDITWSEDPRLQGEEARRDG